MAPITCGDVMLLHEMIVEQTGGLQGVRDARALESSVAQPFQSVFGSDLYPEPYARAAALGFFLTNNHPFLDGNKRTALLVMSAYLSQSGVQLDVDEQALYDLMVDVADRSTGLEGLTGFLERHGRDSITHIGSQILNDNLDVFERNRRSAGGR